MLTTSEMSALEALTDTIIPPDDWPGAVAAGVCNFILHLLANEENWHVDAYHLGLAALDRLARGVHDLPFDGLTLAQRTSVLEMVEQQSQEAVASGIETSWLGLVIRHCAEGYYADSGNGGNFDQLSWAMVGYKVTI